MELKIYSFTTQHYSELINTEITVTGFYGVKHRILIETVSESLLCGK